MNLYDASVPVYVKMLENLAQILAKSQSWAKEQGKSEDELLDAKLAPDMFPLIRQVQIASDHAKGISARLAGQEPPKIEDVETTFDQAIERIRKTVDYLKTLDPALFEGASSRQIPFPYVPDTYLLAEEALFESSLPNFFFHVTTAYGILRREGVPLGKADFIGHLPLKAIQK